MTLLRSLRWAVRDSSLHILLASGLAFGAVACGGGSGTPGDDPSHVGDGGTSGDDDAGEEVDATYELDANDIDYVRDTGTDSTLDAAPPAVCGNGKFEEKELCDDGNT